MKLTGVKVLVIDDDYFFREILKKSIEDSGANVMAVESIDFAKKAVPYYSPNLILSDVQMPGGSGIEFLVWAKENDIKIPIIIMTGFSELADAASAAAAGASGFLAKPFKQEELQKILNDVHQAAIGEAAPTQAAVEPQRELDFMKVSVEDLIVGSQIQVPIYLRLPSGDGVRFVKVAHQGEDLSLERVRTYKAKGVNHLFLAREDYMKYVGMTVQMTKRAGESSAISDEKRARLIRNTMEVVEQQIFCEEITPEVFDHAKTLVEVSVSAITGTDAGYLVLEAVKEISDELYAHAAAVSMIGSMIGKAIGWTSPKTLAKVAMAGMLHDIGKKQLPRELALKSKAQMDAAELSLYETHAAKGMAILSELDFVPTDVVQAVSHHHERGNGLGFPAHLTENKIFPLAKVIAVADEFANIYLKNEVAREKKDPHQSLRRLMELRSEGLAAEPLVALYRAFGATAPEHLLKKVKRDPNHGS